MQLKTHFYLKSDNSLSEEDVSDSGIDVLGDWVSGVDHKSVSEFHGLGSLTSQFTRDDDLTTLNEKSLRIELTRLKSRKN